MLVHDLLEYSAARYPDQVALVCGEHRFTYAELNAQAEAIAGALAAAGVQRGDRVVLHMDNAAETVIGLFATLKIGAIFSVINPTTKRAKLVQILDNCRPTALIVDEGRLETVTGIDAEADSLRYLLAVAKSAPDGVTARARAETWAAALARRAPRPPVRVIDLDLAAIIYTSGSTGMPKGVMSAHRNVLAATTSINGYLHNTPRDVILDVLPLSFDYGLYQIFLAFQVG
ncbi:MAG: AMP-dependent synthetase, partial [Chloroflexota bacterium]